MQPSWGQIAWDIIIKTANDKFLIDLGSGLLGRNVTVFRKGFGESPNPFRLSFHYLYIKFSMARAIKLTKINGLPHTQHQRAMVDNYRLAGAHTAGF